MANKSNKTIYHLVREELNLSRDQASELLETITPERLERIEKEKFSPHPDEILTMSRAYKKPELCNYYCAQQCPIGNEYVPKVNITELSQIVLEMIAAVNSIEKQKDRLVEITVDSNISDDEIEEFVQIQSDLEKMSVAVETLQLWTERMLANGQINKELYDEYISNKR